MSKTHPHGFCECASGNPEKVKGILDEIADTLMFGTDSVAFCCIGTGPAAWSVVRNGRAMKVCTHCTLFGDKDRELLVTREDNLKLYENYDDLGALAIIRVLEEA